MTSTPVTRTVYVPATVYLCGIETAAVMVPRDSGVEPSPKSSETELTVVVAAGVTTIVAVPFMGTGTGEAETDSPVTGADTITLVEPVTASPETLMPEARTAYVPGAEYRCAREVSPVRGPSCSLRPSPKSSTTLRTTSPAWAR